MDNENREEIPWSDAPLNPKELSNTRGLLFRRSILLALADERETRDKVRKYRNAWTKGVAGYTTAFLSLAAVGSLIWNIVERLID